MGRVVRWIVRIVVSLALLLGVLWLFGPREPMISEAAFDPTTVDDDLDAWLTAREARFPDIRPGAQKRIVWRGAPGTRTPLAVVYVHGFSADAEEIRPVPDRVASALGANLFFTRLTGHGRTDGAAMAEPDMGDWMTDIAEAMEIGRRLGDRVLLITTSTGGTLAVAGAFDPEIGRDLAGVALVSPNFGPADPMADLATWPLARQWVPLLAGAERSWEPLNPEQGDHWNTRYPTTAVLPMMALVKYVRGLDLGDLRVPAFFVYSPDDQVVDAARTDAAYAAWAGPKGRIQPRLEGRTADPFAHVIAGDILSPDLTDEVAVAVTVWAGGL
ncbi:MAG: alpha/beta hydrolase [Pseudomonadota bacterium]